tara:strand:+ start:2996 stop:3154 length:159 start_codon:yes stop_codon:yes gene_type:complete
MLKIGKSKEIIMPMGPGTYSRPGRPKASAKPSPKKKKKKKASTSRKPKMVGY